MQMKTAMKDNKTAILIKKLSLEFDKISIPELAPYNLTPTQYKVIKYLLRNQESKVRQKDIEVAYSMTNPTVTGILQNLEKNRWIERVENSDDARSKVIKLSKKALKQKDELYKLGDGLERRFLKGLDRTEQKQLNELLNKLFNSIRENL